jgi:hypothetical protein
VVDPFPVGVPTSHKEKWYCQSLGTHWIQGSRHEGFDLFGFLYFRAEAVLDLKPEEDDNEGPNSPKTIFGLTGLLAV